MWNMMLDNYAFDFQEYNKGVKLAQIEEAPHSIPVIQQELSF